MKRKSQQTSGNGRTPVPQAFKVWARSYLKARSTKSFNDADIQAMFEAVVMVIEAGIEFSQASEEQFYERAYEAYCDAVEAVCRRRGHEKQSPRNLRAANDH